MVADWNESGARERFWTTWFGNDAGAPDYFGPRARVTLGLDRTRPLGLTDEFLDYLEVPAMTSGAFTYQTYWHFNLS